MSSMDDDVKLCRMLLVLLMPDVRKVTTAAQRNAAWTYRFKRGQWEFHGPNKFYWYGRAANAYDARCKGWTAYLSHTEKTS